MEQISTIEIDWIRHAESCANFDSNNYKDEAPSDYNQNVNIGYNQKLTTNETQGWWLPNIPDLTNLTTIAKAPFKYQPNLSFIGMQQAILLNEVYISKQNDYDVVFASPTVRAIMTAMLGFRGKNVKIYVIPYISEHLNLLGKIEGDYQNKPVKSNILRRIVLFLKDWLSTKWFRYYDDIQVMQKLINLRDILTSNGLELMGVNSIDSVIQCKPYVHNSSYRSHTDFGYLEYYKECFTHMDNLLKYLEYVFKDDKIQQKLKTNNTFKHLEQFFKNIIDENKRKSYFSGPSVNVSVLEYFEKIDQNIIPDFEKFYSDILPYLRKEGIIKKNTKIAAVSHGGALKHAFKTSALKNVQVIKQFINFDTGEQIGDIDPKAYDPISIRTNFKNFEIVNMDICRTESIKGFINYPLWDIKSTPKMYALKYPYLTNLRDQVVNPDIKEFMPRPDPIIMEDLARYYKYDIEREKKELEEDWVLPESNMLKPILDSDDIEQEGGVIPLLLGAGAYKYYNSKNKDDIEQGGGGLGRMMLKSSHTLMKKPRNNKKKVMNKPKKKQQAIKKSVNTPPKKEKEIGKEKEIVKEEEKEIGKEEEKEIVKEEEKEIGKEEASSNDCKGKSWIYCQKKVILEYLNHPDYTNPSDYTKKDLFKIFKQYNDWLKENEPDTKRMGLTDILTETSKIYKK